MEHATPFDATLVATNRACRSKVDTRDSTHRCGLALVAIVTPDSTAWLLCPRCDNIGPPRR